MAEQEVKKEEELEEIEIAELANKEIRNKDAEIAKLKKDIHNLKNELKREISDLKEYQKEPEDLICKVIKAMDENGSVIKDDDLFIIADLMKN